MLEGIISLVVTFIIQFAILGLVSRLVRYFLKKKKPQAASDTVFISVLIFLASQRS